MRTSFQKPFSSLLLLLCLSLAVHAQKPGLKIMTVTGEMPASEMGVTLTHEHVLVDFIQVDSITSNRWNRDTVVARVLPYFQELRQYKVNTFVDCTPEFIGRDPLMLFMLSQKSKINILTNTGWYAADKERHLPRMMDDMTSADIARLWIDEAKNGIGNSGIRPGFIKIGINNVLLSEKDKKLVEASCITHLSTGLVIMSHTGVGDAALAQLEILKHYGVDPSAFIWTHAQSETLDARFMEIYRMGAWIALDGIRAGKSMDQVVNRLKFLKSQGALDRVLLSHDAGWYDPAKPGGGTIRPYTDLFTSFMPRLLNEGFTREDFELMMVKNPAEAFGVRHER